MTVLVMCQNAGWRQHAESPSRQTFVADASFSEWCIGIYTCSTVFVPSLCGLRMIVSGPRDTDCAFDSLDFTSTILFDRQTPESRDQSNWTHRLGPLHHVIRELVDTEASYLQNLYELESCYFEPLQEDPSLDPESLSLIFGRIPALRRFHESIHLLEGAKKSRSELWCKLAQCQRTVGHQLSVDTYLLKPVQRILKYQLMLQVTV
ncbi:unnamed protein product [Dicrocoelium dendriticum]|nr:unnamed protein product [Dicrocoelium dendriticum]